MRKSTWSEHDRDVLRATWGTLSAAMIGQRVGRSKSAVIGEAHRLELRLLAPSRGKGLGRGKKIVRQAPVERPPKPAPRLKAGAASLAPLPSTVSSIEIPPPPVKPGPSARRYADAVGPISPCCWMSGEQRREYISCDAPSIPGKPYCAKHLDDAHGRGQSRKAKPERESVKQPPGGRLTAWGIT